MKFRTGAMRLCLPPPPRPLHSVHIAWERLLLQIGIVVIGTGIAFVAMGGDKKEPPTQTPS